MAPIPQQEYQRAAGELAQLRQQRADFAIAFSRVQDPATWAHHVRNINALAERIQSVGVTLRAASWPVS